MRKLALKEEGISVVVEKVFSSLGGEDPSLFYKPLRRKRGRIETLPSISFVTLLLLPITGLGGYWELIDIHLCL